jgi:hypothetical protein
VDTLSPGGPLTIGAQSTIASSTPILCARGNLDGLDGDDFCIVESAITPAFKRGGGSNAGGVVRPIRSIIQIPGCPADLTHDWQVNGDDLSILLSGFGGPGAGDINHDGNVGGEDLAILIGSWGICAN